MESQEYKEFRNRKNQQRRERYIKKRDEYTARMGGKCKICGSTDRLAFIHKDLRTRKFGVTSGFYQKSRAETEAELQKCILLCGTHAWEHIVKRRAEIRESKGVKLRKEIHGTMTGYPFCGPPKCEACREVKRVHNKTYQDKQKMQKLMQGKVKLLGSHLSAQETGA